MYLIGENDLMMSKIEQRRNQQSPRLEVLVETSIGTLLVQANSRCANLPCTHICSTPNLNQLAGSVLTRANKPYELVLLRCWQVFSVPTSLCSNVQLISLEKTGNSYISGTGYCILLLWSIKCLSTEGH